MILVGALGDFIANEKPIYCRIDGDSYFPIFKNYGVNLGLTQWQPIFITNDWSTYNYDTVIFPLIPYSANTTDLNNANYKGPFDEQNIKSTRYKHWLGTDGLGRDVAAGIIGGLRIVLMVGFISMFVATILGLLFGSISGYFGDDKLYITRARLLVNLIALPLATFYGFIININVIISSLWGEDSKLEGGVLLLTQILIFILIFIFFNFIDKLLLKIPIFKQSFALPVDIVIMRIIEVIHSVPILLLILAVLSIIEKPSIIYVIFIIGFIRWTNIARFVRAELLRVREMEYINAVKVMGLSQWKIITKHALPNSLAPALISIAFGVASAVLLESFLSFLGIGVAVEEVTWGIILKQARNNFSAWWLAVFPGAAIFITVTIFNLIGEGLNDALDPRHRHDTM